MMKLSSIITAILSGLLLSLAACPVIADAADARDSSDHPVLSRYPDSRIQTYSQSEFDQYPLALGVTKNAPANVETIEGRVTRIDYVNPPGRSSLEIYTNYAQALADAGFETLWSCAGQGCGRASAWQSFNGLWASGKTQEIRMLAVRSHQESQTITVALAVNSTGTAVHVIESRTLDGGLVHATAAQLAEGIDRDGFVSIYDILFDTGSAAILPASAAAIGQVAQLLSERPALKVRVVGHTDSTGGFELNMKLSADRAQAVMQSLTDTHGIAAARLSAHGVGPLAPLASNRSAAGRAKNRRVDLVEQ